MHAEQVYLFRHAIVRDAAYTLFLPKERVDLHRAAIDGYEQLYAGDVAPHAEELLLHARAAIEFCDTESSELHSAEYHFLRMASEHCAKSWRVDDELAYLHQLEAHSVATPAERIEFSLRRAQHLMERGELVAAGKIAEAATAGATKTGSEFLAARARLLNHRTRYRRGQVDDDAELQSLVDQLKQHGATETRMSALLDLAELHERSGDSEAAVLAFQDALEITEALQDHVLRAECLCSRGLFLHRIGRSNDGETDVRNALEIAHDTTNLKLEVDALTILGVILVDRSRHDEGAKCYGAALRIAREIGLKSTTSTLLKNLANLHFFFHGNITRAERVYLEVLESIRETGEVHAIAHSHGVLGLMYEAAGELDRARECFQVVLDHARRLGDRVTEAKAHMGLALSMPPDTALEQADSVFSDAISQLSATPSGSNLSRVWSALGGYLLDAGHIRAAQQAIQEALATEPAAWRAQATAANFQLLAGDPELGYLESYREVSGNRDAPQSRLSLAMKFDFMERAAAQARLEELAQLATEMHELAGTFEWERFKIAREALQLVDATLAARRNENADLWRGLAVKALPPRMVQSLRNRADGQAPLAELLPRVFTLRSEN